MSVVKNVNADLRWSNAPVLRYCGLLLLVCLITQFIHVWILILRNTCEVPLTRKSEPHPKMLKEPTVLWCPFTLVRISYKTFCKYIVPIVARESYSRRVFTTYYADVKQVRFHCGRCTMVLTTLHSDWMSWTLELFICLPV